MLSVNIELGKLIYSVAFSTKGKDGRCYIAKDLQGFENPEDLDIVLNGSIKKSAKKNFFKICYFTFHYIFLL